MCTGTCMKHCPHDSVQLCYGSANATFQVTVTQLLPNDRTVVVVAGTRPLQSPLPWCHTPDSDAAVDYCVRQLAKVDALLTISV